MLTLLLACSNSVPLGSAPVSPSAVDHETVLADWIVDCHGGADFDTIGEAIDAAESEQTIDVKPCTYAENIDFGGKALVLRSTGGSANTVIEAPGGTAVRAASGESDGTAIIGFTISGGTDATGGAVYVDFSSLRLEDVLLTDNRATYLVYAESGDVELEDVTFAGNSLRNGALVYASRGGLVVHDTSFDCDNGAYGIYTGHGSAYVDDSSFACAAAASSYWNHTVGRIRRSVIDGPIAVEAETDHYDDFVVIENSIARGGISANYGSLTVRNSVIDGQVSVTNTYSLTQIEGTIFTGATCAISSAMVVIPDTDTGDTAIPDVVGPFVVRNNLFWDVPRSNCTGTDYVGVDDNIEGDPLFADFAADDVHLGSGSPAVDAGPEDTGYADVDGSRNDIGVFGGHGSMDGGW